MRGKQRKKDRGADRETSASTTHAAGQPTPSHTTSRASGAARLGEMLLEAKAIDPSGLASALAAQESSERQIGQLLLDQGLVSDGDLARALAEQLDLPLADLDQHTPDPTAVALLPEAIARMHSAIPLSAAGGTVQVILANPTDEARQAVIAAVGLAADSLLGPARRINVEFLIGPAGDVRRALDAAYRATAGVKRLVDAFEVAEVDRESTTSTRDTDNTGTDADAPVVRVVHVIMTQALRDRASDVHIEPQADEVRVRFRVDGALHDAVMLPATIGPALISRLKILAGMNIVERRRPQDGQFTLDIDNTSVDVRVATVNTIWGEKCVLRLLDKSRSLMALSDLGMPAEAHATFSKLARSPFGMVLCAGPTGSGKTTTLYATLAELNESRRNIMTIEDPVEYVFPSVNQIQTNEAIGMNFATGLRSILRQDPDVILVGECRDAETARIAVQSALTGHFVLSTLHATDSVAALHRLLDMGIESFLLASSILAIVGQRLVRRICDSCKEMYTPTAEELAFYIEAGGADPERTEFWQGAGCNACAGTGYKDRIGVYELLRITPELKRLIVGWATQDELRRLAVSQGMRTLEQEAVALVDRDVTTLSEIIRTIFAL